MAMRLLSVVAAALGNPFPTTIYIGHPGWKAMGARWGYSLLNGVVITALCLIGGVTLVLKIVPLEAMIGAAYLDAGFDAALQVVRDQLGRFLYPFHRLDRATSGVLLFAGGSAIGFYFVMPMAIPVLLQFAPASMAPMSMKRTTTLSPAASRRCIGPPTGTTSRPGMDRTRCPIPGRNGATTPGSPRLPSGKKIRVSPPWSASIIGCSAK